MSSLAISAVVFGCVFAGALLGLALRTALPQHHLSSDSKDVVKLGMGLIGTMTALILGLLVASAKGSYDDDKALVSQMSAKIIFLDRVLAHYGPESRAFRVSLKSSIEGLLARMWPERHAQPAQLDPSVGGSEDLFGTLQELGSQTEAQRFFKGKAEEVINELSQMRWLLFEQTGSSVSMPFLAVVVFWLTLIFVSFGLFSPRNATVIVSLLLCAFSVSGAIFLILELDQPFGGVIQISSVPVRTALEHLGR